MPLQVHLTAKHIKKLINQGTLICHFINVYRVRSKDEFHAIFSLFLCFKKLKGFPRSSVYRSLHHTS